MGREMLYQVKMASDTKQRFHLAGNSTSVYTVTLLGSLVFGDTLFKVLLINKIFLGYQQCQLKKTDISKIISITIIWV
jgi:hypothetical protein